MHTYAQQRHFWPKTPINPENPSVAGAKHVA
jgi:hypothetical protein